MRRPCRTTSIPRTSTSDARLERTVMSNTWQENAGLFALRAGVGGVLVAHGVQKLFGWLGGHGLAGTGAAFEQMGFQPGRQSAFAAGLGEAGGGVLIALGLATPAAGAAAAGTMIPATAVHAPSGLLRDRRRLRVPGPSRCVRGGADPHGPRRLVVGCPARSSSQPALDGGRGHHRFFRGLPGDRETTQPSARRPGCGNQQRHRGTITSPRPSASPCERGSRPSCNPDDRSEQRARERIRSGFEPFP